ncbi:MAG: prepilin-type N-terminal cleavage/methylation domain-containing protein [Mariprofundus sp.]|nr:prepilin-type N-terminal cleavage/methylation domain-containing protein [Mariprofundus sp.]
MADMDDNSSRGFTLLEVMMALTIFSMIVALAYGALGVAGDGFKTVSAVRDTLEKSGWLGRQLRSDMAYLALPAVALVGGGNVPSAAKTPLMISSDNRGDTAFDQLWLQVAEPGKAGISEVHYYIDEELGHLMRESRLLWARYSVEPMRWDMGEAASFSVEALATNGRWEQVWKKQGVFIWPRALKIKMQYGKKGSDQREWEIPLQYGIEL